MLNRLIGTSSRVVRMQTITTQARFYRPGTVNLYKHDPTPISDQEKIAQESKPVWDRVFDH